ncbi:MAG: antibiotic resistance protein MarC [Methanoculleus sp. SDB]|nr:MAG: antibiotic resistance protein MarC [Methanoculleus sp. SDB]
MDGDILSFALLSLSSLLIIVNPLAATMVYVTLTDGMERAIKHDVAKVSCQVAGAILVTFAVAGSYILQLFGITLDAFQIAGGVLLFGIGIEMVNAKTSRTKMTATEKYESIDAESVSVMPLAIPMISGPGSITTAVVLSNQAGQNNVFLIAIVIGAIAASILVTYVLLTHADSVTSRIGQREFRVINRVMGILLIAIAVQFVINGISTAFPMLSGGV